MYLEGVARDLVPERLQKPSSRRERDSRETLAVIRKEEPGKDSFSHGEKKEERGSRVESF